MNDIKELITTLIDHTYDSGYYSGRGDDGKMIHARAIADRNQARNDLLVRLETDAARLAAAEAEAQRLRAVIEQMIYLWDGYAMTAALPITLREEAERRATETDRELDALRAECERLRVTLAGLLDDAETALGWEHEYILHYRLFPDTAGAHNRHLVSFSRTIEQARAALAPGEEE
jgi:cell division septum initiation protein DivIVA